MNGFNDILEMLANKDNRQDGDYIDSDGFLVCGKCNTRKQSDIDWPLTGGKKRVPIMCRCVKDKQKTDEEADKQRKFKEHIVQLRKDGISDAKYYDYRFDLDDGKSPKISRACRNYVESWQDMLHNNIGILFYGSVGTGKTFMACCIANALLDKMTPTAVTNFPRVLNILQGFGDEKQDFIDRLQRYDLLVIDDLGVERNTPYAAEQVFNVVDGRSRSGKPLEFPIEFIDVPQVYKDVVSTESSIILVDGWNNSTTATSVGDIYCVRPTLLEGDLAVIITVYAFGYWK